MLGRELNEALDTSAGMFRPLALVAMRQEHDEAREQIPLCFAGTNELVDDRLCDVDEVSELGFPEDKGFGIVAAVSILESENSGFGERGVVDLAAGLAGGDVFERHVFVFVLDINQDGVSLVESAPARILSRHADVRAHL